MRESHLLSDVLPQPFLAVEPQHEPYLQGAEPAAKRDVPVPVVGDLALVLVLKLPQSGDVAVAARQSTPAHVYLEVEGIDVESVDQLVLVLHPHGGAVEVDEQPLVHVEVEGVGELDAVEDGPVLRADEGAARVRRVYVQPQALGVLLE